LERVDREAHRPAAAAGGGVRRHAGSHVQPHLRRDGRGGAVGRHRRGAGHPRARRPTRRAAVGLQPRAVGVPTRVWEAIMTTILPTGSKERKALPIASGVLDYFPAALAAVADVSRAGNDKHNPGQPLHWSRGKSMDHADCIARHLLERGTVDAEDGLPHSAKLAWRALALLQEELEAAGAPLARGAKVVYDLSPPEETPPLARCPDCGSDRQRMPHAPGCTLA